MEVTIGSSSNLGVHHRRSNSKSSHGSVSSQGSSISRDKYDHHHHHHHAIVHPSSPMMTTAAKDKKRDDPPDQHEMTMMHDNAPAYSSSSSSSTSKNANNNAFLSRLFKYRNTKNNGKRIMSIRHHHTNTRKVEATYNNRYIWTSLLLLGCCSVPVTILTTMTSMARIIFVHPMSSSPHLFLNRTIKGSTTGVRPRIVYWEGKLDHPHPRNKQQHHHHMPRNLLLNGKRFVHNPDLLTLVEETRVDDKDEVDNHSGSKSNNNNKGVGGDCVDQEPDHTIYPICNSVHEHFGKPDTRLVFLAHGSQSIVFEMLLDVDYGEEDDYYTTREEDPNNPWWVLKMGHYDLDYFIDTNNHGHDKEAMILENLSSSSYVLNIYGVCGTTLINPYAKSNLFHLLKSLRNGGRPLQNGSVDVLKIAYQLSKGLATLHDFGYYHNDLDPSQYLYNPHRQIYQLNDFNEGGYISSICPSHNRNIEGWRYRAPEDLATCDDGSGPSFYKDKADIYSLGAIIYELLTKKWIWEDIPKHKRAAEKIFHGIKLPIPYHIVNRSKGNRDDAKATRAILEIIDKCWQFDPDHRPTAHEVCDYLRTELRGIVPSKRKQRKRNRRDNDDDDDDMYRVLLPPLKVVHNSKENYGKIMRMISPETWRRGLQ